MLGLLFIVSLYLSKIGTAANRKWGMGWSDYLPGPSQTRYEDETISQGPLGKQKRENKNRQPGKIDFL